MLSLLHKVTNHILSICSLKSTGCDWSAYGNLLDVIGSLSIPEGAHSSLLGVLWKKGFPSYYTGNNSETVLRHNII